MLTDEQQREVIPELDDFTYRANEIKKEIDYLQSRLQLNKDEQLCQVYLAASKLVGTLTTVNEGLKQGRADWVKDAITGWYRDLHFDMHPVVPVPEEDITDPVYESVDYKGDGKWEIVMCTPTHGREKIVLHACNGIDWTGVHSAEPIEQGVK